jgi:hypothetical protein
MQLSAPRLAAAALALLPISMLGLGPVLGEPRSDSPPSAVVQAIAATPAPYSPAKVVVGTQFLTVVMEDTISGEDAQVYVPDPDGSIGLDPEITLPGFKVGKPKMQIASNTYPTNFGDLADPEATAYSRLTLSIPVTRPIMAMSVKTFVPIVLIVVCAALVFFVRPHYVEGRIGLGITALLTLVALQLTSSASLPDVDYLMMLDKIYLLAYVFIIVALARVVMTSWRGADENDEKAISRTDRIWVAVLLIAYLAANAAIALPALV